MQNGIDIQKDYYNKMTKNQAEAYIKLLSQAKGLGTEQII
jgi:hypothetical protein